MTAVNRHGTLVVADRSGIFVTGPSGSGKTRLALRLLSHCAASGCFARLVGDDQIFLSAANGRLIGRAPATIAGLAEARGLGPARVEHEPAAVVDLLVRLAPAAQVPRVGEGKEVLVEGVPLPSLDLPQRDSEGALLAIAARLSLPPFA